MGLFKRFTDALRANINDLISKAENPEKMLNQIIMDMNEHLIEAKKSVASAIADEKRLERLRELIPKAMQYYRQAVHPRP